MPFDISFARPTQLTRVFGRAPEFLNVKALNIVTDQSYLFYLELPLVVPFRPFFESFESTMGLLLRKLPKMYKEYLQAGTPQNNAKEEPILFLFNQILIQ